MFCVFQFPRLDTTCFFVWPDVALRRTYLQWLNRSLALDMKPSLKFRLVLNIIKKTGEFQIPISSTWMLTIVCLSGDTTWAYHGLEEEWTTKNQTQATRHKPSGLIFIHLSGQKETCFGVTKLYLCLHHFCSPSKSLPSESSVIKGQMTLYTRFPNFYSIGHTLLGRYQVVVLPRYSGKLLYPVVPVPVVAVHVASLILGSRRVSYSPT